MRQLKLAAPVLIGLAGPACWADSLTIVDTLGPANGYTLNTGWSVGGGSADGPTGANYVAVQRFQSLADGVLASATLPMWRLQGSAQFSVGLLLDNAGTPGQQIATAVATAPETLGLVSTTFAGSVPVTAGSYYWVSLSTTDLSAALWWSMNTLGLTGLTGFTGALWQAPGEWFYQTAALGAIRMEVSSPVPELSTAALFAVAALPLLLAVRARRSRALQ